MLNERVRRVLLAERSGGKKCLIERMCPGVAILAGVPIVGGSCLFTFTWLTEKSRKSLSDRLDAVMLPAARCAQFQTKNLRTE